MKEMAPVSVIIPCYRCVKTIGRALLSVAHQTILPAEVILVDDCSGDSTLVELGQLQNQYDYLNILVLSLSRNSGPGTARNRGWERATQTYIAFLDADDAWHPQKIELQLRWMVGNPEATITSHACKLETEGGSFFYAQSYSEAHFFPVSKHQILIKNAFKTRSVMLKRDVPYRFKDGKRYSEDYLLWCEICLNGYLGCVSNLPLAFIFKPEFGSGGLSGDLWKMEIGEMHTFFVLMRRKLISVFCFLSLCIISSIKFAKRLVSRL